jgi:L-asparaginase II
VSDFKPLIEVWRGDILESTHFGAIAVVGTDGELVDFIGDIDCASYPRSAAKLMQATAMVKAGLDLAPNQLALVAASHSGGDTHVQVLNQILQQHGFTSTDLKCTPFLPLGSKERKMYSGAPSSDRSDCSGKHSGFLVTTKINEWDLETYLEPSHPLQNAIKKEIELQTSTPVKHTTVDGCGAPLYSSSLHGLAVAFNRAVQAVPESAERQVADAMRAYPELVGGSGREVTEAMKSLPGLLCKDGADGVFAMAHPDHGAVAFKISDGGVRGVNLLIREILTRWGVQEFSSELRDFPVIGGGKSVGKNRPSAALANLKLG